MKILVMFNLEFVYILKEKFGKENMKNVWFMTPCSNKGLFAKGLGVNENNIRLYSYNNKEIIEGDSMPKFDVVVGNPPYKNGLHMKFLEIAHNMSNQHVVFVHPAIWLLSDAGHGINPEIIKILKLDTKEIVLINGNSYFPEAALAMPLSISILDKQNIKNGVIFTDRVNVLSFLMTDLNNVNIWGDYEVFPNLKEKIIKLAKVKNCRNTQQRRVASNWVVSFSKIRGNIHKDSGEFFRDDFYTPMPKDHDKLGYGPLNEVPDKWVEQFARNWYGFNTEIEAHNFLSFIKSRWGMFALSLNKFNLNIQTREVERIPWLDFKQAWPEEKFARLIDATSEEIDFIEKNIPDYYND